MRQLLLRVPDELHERLAARAARDGTSVNQLATMILNSAVDADRGSLRDQVRARAAAQGVLDPGPPVPVPALDPDARQRAIDGMRGIGPVLDDLLAEDRGRLDRLRGHVDPRTRLPSGRAGA